MPAPHHLEDKIDEMLAPAIDVLKRVAQSAINQAAHDVRNVLRVTYETTPEMNPDGCPLPRMQLRWRENDDKTLTCFHEFVFPIWEYDIRSTDFNGSLFGVVELGRCTRSGSTTPDWASNLAQTYPFRTSAHAVWDAVHFGNPPIYVVAPNGSFALMEQHSTKIESERTFS